MGQKLKSAPVYFTVCQIRHNPLLSLESYLPRIQEDLRKCGYPDFKPRLDLAFNVTAGAQESGVLVAPPFQKINQFHFFNAEATAGFVLLNNALAFQTTAYDTFEVFSKQLRRGLEILHEVVGGLSFTERLGLRYLDAVVPRRGESLDQYLANELLGLPAKMLDHQFGYSFSESTLHAEGVGQVVARAVLQNGALAFPPDLTPNQLKVNERFNSITGDHAVIDTDGSNTERRPFDIDELQRSLQAIHDLIIKVFDAMTTDHARAVWKHKEN